MLIIDKVNFRTKNITRIIQHILIMITNQEIVKRTSLRQNNPNVYAPNNTISNCKKEKPITPKRCEQNHNVVRDLNTTLSINSQMISKYIVDLNNTIRQLNLIDIYRTFH